MPQRNAVVLCNFFQRQIRISQMILYPCLDRSQPRPLHSMVRRRLIAMPGIQRKSDDNIHQLVAKPGSHVGIQR